jgi:hypothetical protein
MALESAAYFVMHHYSLSLTDLDKLTPEGFSMMFTWAAASVKHQAEQSKDGQAASQDKMRIGSTDMSRPMPHSEGL